MALGTECFVPWWYFGELNLKYGNYGVVIYFFLKSNMNLTQQSRQVLFNDNCALQAQWNNFIIKFASKNDKIERDKTTKKNYVL